MKKSKPSFEKINYIFRPKKQIERKILIELFQKIQNTLDINISEYQYIGLGSIYYYDFILFHKYLNIRDMISLDDKDYPNRFEFNKPFDFITFKPMSTTDFLSKNDLNKKSFIWFDYDSSLIRCKKKKAEFLFFSTETIFDDIRLIANKSNELDLFVLTVNINIQKTLFESPRFRQAFIDEYDEYLSDQYKKVNKITFKKYPLIIQNIIINIFRNNEQFHPVKFRKLFSFIYQDGAPMYTIGGMFTKDSISKKVTEKDSFFETDENKVVNIDVPLLTYYEKIKLDKKIVDIEKNLDSLNEEKIIEILGFEMEPSELRNYLYYHRYYPQYYEGII
ncbi:hypothetical protein ES705_30652 [subsurface metagenome]